jgi:ATP phosphoribosyltransferase regulatory subunit
MVYQPPVGARDLLPLDVAQKRWIEDRLQQIFHRWGYHRIITSTLERLDTLMAGGAVQPSTVIQIQNGDDEALGLRPELTASIARAAVTRMAGATYPQRLYYNANVFRRGNRGIQNRQREYYQAGVELLGVGGVAADAEILLLLWDGLRSLNLGQWYVVLGDAGLTRSLLSEFPAALQAQVREAIAHLDRMALEALPLTAQQRDRALALLDLRGKASDVLQRVSRLDLTLDQRQTVNQLKTLLELLEQTVDTSSLVLDLSLIQTFDYYTGIVFEVVSSSESGKRVLGQGGRYDQLLSLYHPQSETIPGIGFVLNIEDLHQVLLPTGQLPAETPASSWLVAPASEAAWGAAFAYAQTIRESTTLVRVEVDLVERSSPDETRRYAQHRQIAQIAWVSSDGTPTIEAIAAPLNQRSC